MARVSRLDSRGRRSFDGVGRRSFSRPVLVTTISAALAGTAILIAAFSSSSPAPALVAVGIGLTLGLATLPLSTIATLVVVASVFSAPAFILPVAGLNLRPETPLIPIALIAVIINGKIREFSRWLTHPLVTLLLAFITLNIVSTALNSPDFGSSMSVAIWYLLDLLALLIVLTAWGEDREKLYRRLKLVAGLAVTAGILGWATLQLGGPAWGAVVDVQSGLRATGISFEANILAGYAAIWLYILLTQRRRPSTSEWWLIAGCTIVIPLTATRAAIVAVCLGLAIALFANGRVLRRLVPLALVTAFSLAAAITAFPSIIEDTFSKFSDFAFSNQTSTFRYATWDLAWTDINYGLNWLFGLGTNSYGQRHTLLTDPTNTREGYLGNLPLQTLYDTGIVGCLVLAGAVLSLLAGQRGRNLSRRAGAIALLTVVAVACNPMFLASFWVLAGLALARDREKDASDRA